MNYPADAKLDLLPFLHEDHRTRPHVSVQRRVVTGVILHNPGTGAYGGAVPFDHESLVKRAKSSILDHGQFIIELFDNRKDASSPEANGRFARVHWDANGPIRTEIADYRYSYSRVGEDNIPISHYARFGGRP